MACLCTAPVQGVSVKNWDSIGAGAMSLFVFVTADGWTELQEALDADGRTGSRVFTTLFMVPTYLLLLPPALASLSAT
jgi:hypothetical protein